MSKFKVGDFIYHRPTNSGDCYKVIYATDKSYLVRNSDQGEFLVYVAGEQAYELVPKKVTITRDELAAAWNHMIIVLRIPPSIHVTKSFDTLSMKLGF